MKYDEFELRTAGTNIMNRVFDWQHIRYFEIVFERTFGDGVCLFSDIKAVRFEDYKDMFVDKMDFRMSDPKDWTYENYDFRKDMIISEDGSELTLGFALCRGRGRRIRRCCGSWRRIRRCGWRGNCNFLDLVGRGYGVK